MGSIILCSVCTTALFWPSHEASQGGAKATPEPERSTAWVNRSSNQVRSVPVTPVSPAFATDPESVRRRSEMYAVMREQVHDKMSAKYVNAEMSYGERSAEGPQNRSTPTTWGLVGETFTGTEARQWRATFIGSHDGNTVNWVLEDLSDKKVETYSFPTPDGWIW